MYHESGQLTCEHPFFDVNAWKSYRQRVSERY